MQTPNPMYIDDFLRQPYAAQLSKKLPGYNRAILLDAGPEGFVLVDSLAPSVPRSIRAVLGLWNIGAMGYLAGSDIHIIDLQGLADPIAARLLLAGRGRPGHEKVLPVAWIAARFGGPETALARLPGALDAARALGCGELARLLRAVEGPLTFSRFLANVHAAWSLHRLRIPADPAVARRRFCDEPEKRRAKIG